MSSILRYVREIGSTKNVDIVIENNNTNVNDSAYVVNDDDNYYDYNSEDLFAYGEMLSYDEITDTEHSIYVVDDNDVQ